MEHAPPAGAGGGSHYVLAHCTFRLLGRRTFPETPEDFGSLSIAGVRGKRAYQGCRATLEPSSKKHARKSTAGAEIASSLRRKLGKGHVSPLAITTDTVRCVGDATRSTHASHHAAVSRC